MGTVWLAERSDGTMKRRVALKLPRIVWGDTFSERLGREREILATLEHEHIARLYDAGVDAQGRPFLAMEYVEGDPIDTYCRAHTLPLRERIALLLQVMAAVAHAHARLVVHRDLKPGNILVTKGGQVKLLDFGIAKLLEGDRTRQTALTELGGRALTLDYASPEQIRGEPLGTASDVYSMAVVAYQLLSQARPYRLKRGSAAELEEAIAGVEPLLASDAAPSKSLRRELRGDIDAILHRGLKKSIVERYPSVDAFAQDFERYLRGEPVQARPDSAGYRADKFVRRHSFAVAMSAALFVAIVAGGGFSLWQAHVARQQEQLAMLESEKQIAVAELYRETMTRLALLAKDEPAELSRPNAVTALLRQQLKDRAPRFANRPDTLAPQMLAVMVQLSFGNEFEAAIAVGKEYLAHLKAHGASPVEVIQAYEGLGRALYQLQRFDECEAMRRAAVAWAPTAHDGFTDLARLVAMTDLGSILRLRGKRAEALAVLTAGETLAARKFPNDTMRFENLRMLAAFWFGFDDARALQAIEQAQEGYSKDGVKDGSATDDLKANALLNFGDILSAEGRGAEAETALRASEDLFARMHGRTSGNAVRAVGSLANAMALQGDTSRARHLLADTLREVAAEPGGPAAAQARELRRRRLDIAWLSGEPPSVDELSADEVRAFAAP
ncbi:MAG: serine/threonine-protein kinase, partial [Pseudomonadota bacterium]|nr:serine/threonine-protein kinase [Pseudomonadota bacterium]